MRNNPSLQQPGPGSVRLPGGSPAAANATERPAWAYPPARILAPVDFGDASARALQVADALARAHGAALSVLHADIIEAPVYFTHEQAAAIERERQAASSSLERELTRFVRRVTLGPAAMTFVEEAPATAIAEAAGRADLIVMGTHGRRGPSRWWLGSVAERTVRESRVPVLVVRAGDAAPPEAVFQHPMLGGTEARPEGEAARYAEGLAATFRGTAVAHVVTCAEDLVREREATLLVIARRAPDRRWLDTHGERLLRLCTLPMLFVPDRP